MGSTSAPNGLPRPRTILTHNPAGAVLFWDATPWIESFASRDTPPAQALKEMEYEALTIFVSRVSSLPRSEQHLHLVVAFVRTGEISARYHTDTVEGIQTVFTMDGGRNIRLQRGWQASARLGRLPAGIHLQLQSDLPRDLKP